MVNDVLFEGIQNQLHDQVSNDQFADNFNFVFQDNKINNWEYCIDNTDTNYGNHI